MFRVVACSLLFNYTWTLKHSFLFKHTICWTNIEREKRLWHSWNDSIAVFNCVQSLFLPFTSIDSITYQLNSRQQSKAFHTLNVCRFDVRFDIWRHSALHQMFHRFKIQVIIRLQWIFNKELKFFLTNFQQHGLIWHFRHLENHF